VCRDFTVGNEPWSRDAEHWLKEWLWTSTPTDRGETIQFFDEETGALAGYITWRLRRERVLEAESKRWAIQIHFIGIARTYQHEKCTEDCSIATLMFETALEAAVTSPRARPNMPALIDAEVDNTHALAVYKQRWSFEHRRFRTGGDGRRYEELWRPPAAPWTGGASASECRSGTS